MNQRELASHVRKFWFIVAFTFMIVFLLIWSFGADSEEKTAAYTPMYPPKPKIELLSSQENQGNATEYALEFTVTDADIVKVNGNEISSENGKFKQLIPLNKLSNRIKITAQNAEYEHKKDELVFNIKRDETEEEKATKLAGLEKEKKRLRDTSVAVAPKAEQLPAKDEEQASVADTYSNPRVSESEFENKVVAETCAQIEVKRNLKSPSTADFPFWDASEITVNRNGTITVKNYVDSENTYGAMIRTYYSCEVIIIDSENIVCSTECEFAQ